MDDSIRINTRLLRDHVSAVREEKRLAQQLQNKVELLKRISGEGERPAYQYILGRVECLVRYYQKMADALEEVGDEAEYLYRQLAKRLRDENDAARSEISSTFLF